MKPTNGFSLARAEDVFAEAMHMEGGVVMESVEFQSMLFARGVLTEVREVRRSDDLQGGVALRATQRAIFIHPYVLRLVCTNGAVMAHATGSHVLERVDETPAETLEHSLREAVRSCCRKEALEESVDNIKAATEKHGDFSFQLMMMLAHMRPELRSQLMRAIMAQYQEREERGAYGVFNAVTAVARDVLDPALRWSLEERAGEFAFGAQSEPCYA